EYLRRLYLNNDLAEGRYKVDGKPVVVSDIRVPIFAIGTVRDHVTPWISAYKIHQLAARAEVTFVLTSGGHNAGVVSPPNHPRRTFQISTRQADDRYTDPQTWRENIPVKQSSWWPSWQKWLAERSSTRVAAPKSLGAAKAGYKPIVDAPGIYVTER